MITILGNISYCYWSWQQQQAGEESRGWRISSVTPSMGIKFKLLPIEEEKVFPYIYGEIGKEIILSEEVSSDDEDWAKSGEDWIKEEHDEPHFIAGFGLEIPLNERSSISGELGIIHLKKKYEGEGWLKLEELKEWTSYSKIILNYYF